MSEPQRPCLVSSCPRTYSGSRSRESLREHLRKMQITSSPAAQSLLVRRSSNFLIAGSATNLSLESRLVKDMKYHVSACLSASSPQLCSQEFLDSKQILRCPACPKTFDQMCLVKQHIRRKHGTLPKHSLSG